MPAIVAVNDLVNRYPGVSAVDGISFALRKGVCFGLLGPNGAGRSAAGSAPRCCAANR